MALRRVAAPESFTTEYLSLRLQLWALARAHEDYEQINTTAQQRYRHGLADLIPGGASRALVRRVQEAGRRHRCRAERTVGDRVAGP